MSSNIKIAVDAMGGDNSPGKIIDGIIHHHKKNNNVFYKIFGDESEIIKCLDKKIDKNNYKIIKCETVDYSVDLKFKLINVINFDKQKIKELDLKFGEFIGLSIKKFISKNKLALPDLISSHGHTVFHQPNIGKTLQIGSGKVINRITGIRKQVSKSLGFVVPNVRIRDDLSLEANQYRIRIGQTIVGEDEIFPDKKLAIPGDEATTKVQGIEVKDPTFGMDAIWISNFQQNEAEANGYVVVAPESVLATHLSQILSKHSAQLIGQDDVQVLLDNLAQSAPNLVQSVVPKLVPLHNLTSILRTLLNERVPVSDLRCILENLSVLSSQNLSVSDTAEALRPHLSGLLVQQVAPLNQPIQVITLSGELENMLIKMVRQSGDEGLILDANLAQQLIKGISEA